MASTTQETLPPAVLDKYKSAGTLLSTALRFVIDTIAAGNLDVLELSKLSDAKVDEEAAKIYRTNKSMPKGLAFPTTFSINHVVSNFSPLPSAGQAPALKNGDVVKILMGVHIDGYAVIGGETVVVGASKDTPVTGVKADLLAAAHNAAELAIRAAKPGAKNWEITDAVNKALSQYEKVKGVQGVTSWRMEQNDIQAKKTITTAPTPEQRRDSDNNHTLEEGEIYNLYVTVTDAEDAKAKESTEANTTIYCKLPTTYQLKLQTSRSTFSEISKKAGAFPFTVRMLEDEKKAKLGIKECVQHGLLKPFDVQTLAAPSSVAQVAMTFAVNKSGPIRLTPSPIYFNTEGLIKPEQEIKDEEILKALKAPLRATKKKTKKAGEKSEEAKKE